jgi:hypothetical protein
MAVNDFSGTLGYRADYFGEIPSHPIVRLHKYPVVLVQSRAVLATGSFTCRNDEPPHYPGEIFAESPDPSGV